MTYLALAFSSLKASTFSVVRLWKSFRWAILRSLIACLQASMNKGTLHGLFIFYKHRTDLGMVLFAISVRVSVNWAIGSSDRVNSSDNRDTHTVRKDIQSALSNFKCSAEDSSSLREVSGINGKWSLPQKSLWVSQSNSSARDGSQTNISGTVKEWLLWCLYVGSPVFRRQRL